MSDDWRTALRQRLCGDCLIDQPLAPLTTWKVGGPAHCLVRPRHVDDLNVLCEVIQDAGVPWWLLGGGSNVLISDEGLPGVVIQLSHMARIESRDNQRLVVGAGCTLGELVRYTVEQGLGGVEALAGIPGTVGGAVAGNAGAADQQIGQRVVEALVWTPESHQGVTTWSAQQCDFAYRHSALIPEHVVIEVTLQLDRCSGDALRARRAEVLAHRRQAHNVGGANAGSVFRNPPGQQAWRLIDESGMRGVQVGKAQVSLQHANFIVNNGGATAEEIYQLIHQVQDAVARHHGVALQPEVRLLGSFGEMDEG